MMADDKTGNEEEVTPKGAVEVEEKDLDKAAGGAMDFNRPAEQDVALQDNITPELKDSSLKEAAGFSPHQGVTEKKLT